VGCLGIYRLAATRGEETSAVRTAKVFKNGRSQAVRLPKEFRVESGEVYLKKTPEGFLVVARDPWEVFFEGVRELSDDFMAEGRQQPEVQVRKQRT
jgi:antitoxin VapB